MGLLAVEDLTCVRGERVVFEGLGLSLDPGEALLLTGANGSGKSSLLRIIAGLLRPAAGYLGWAGEPIAGDLDRHRARLCYIGHQDPVKPVLSVRENLAFWSALQGGGPERLGPALARFGLAPLADLPGRVLSAGQRRRLNLARLAAGPAPLWLLDEPSIALDRAALAALEAAIAGHRAAGGMVVLATHSPLDLPGARELGLERYGPAVDDVAVAEAAS